MLNNMLSWGKCLLDLVLFFWFSVQFLNHKGAKVRVPPCIIILFLSFLLFFMNTFQIPLLNAVTALACALLMNLFLFEGSLAIRIICSVAEGLLVAIYEFLPSIVSISTDDLISRTGFSLISAGMFIITIMILRHVVIRRMRKHNKDISVNGNLFIIIVPLMSLFIIYHLLYMHHSSPMKAAVIDWQDLLVFAGISLMNIVVIVGDNNSRKHYLFQRKLDRLNQLEQQNRIVIQQQDRFIEELKGFAHDYSKQMDGLKYMLKAADHGQLNHVEKCVDELLESFDECYRFAFIPTPALRVILSQIQLKCTAAHIVFEADIQYGDFSFLSFPDLYGIFENPLSNAVYACREMKEETASRIINLIILRKKNLIWIEIKNTKDHPIKMKNNHIMTTKDDPKWHGLGIKNMKRAVNKYGGYLYICHTVNEFSVTMAIPMP